MKADIVVRNRGYWDLYEVKSSTSVKEHYWDDGATVSEAYFTMGEISDPKELARLRKALLEYCRQDTVGLVRQLEKTRAMAG